MLTIPAPAGLAHGGKRRLGDQKGGLEVHLDHLVEVRLGELVHRARDGDARVVDEDGDRPGPGADRLHHGLDFIRLRYVRPDGKRLPAPGFDQGAGLPGLFFARAEIDGDCGALFRERHRAGPADAPARPRHQGGSALERVHKKILDDEWGLMGRFASSVRFYRRAVGKSTWAGWRKTSRRKDYSASSAAFPAPNSRTAFR